MENGDNLQSKVVSNKLKQAELFLFDVRFKDKVIYFELNKTTNYTKVRCISRDQWSAKVLGKLPLQAVTVSRISEHKISYVIGGFGYVFDEKTKNLSEGVEVLISTE